MEISPFFVYTIVKLDAFCAFMCSCSVICAVIGVLSYFFGHVTADNYCGTEEERRESRRVGRCLSFKVAPVFLVLSFVTLFVCTVIPTTKQAAVIWLLPKVVTEQNMEKVQSEAGELYDLAKQWLTENAKCNINEKDAETKGKQLAEH